MREISKADNGKELEVALGETLELRLLENPTTGYRWQLESSGSPVLEVSEDSFAPAQHAPGAGGVRSWKLRAAQAGIARLELQHRRSWERQATDTFGVTIRVQPR